MLGELMEYCKAELAGSGAAEKGLAIFESLQSRGAIGQIGLLGRQLINRVIGLLVTSKSDDAMKELCAELLHSCRL